MSKTYIEAIEKGLVKKRYEEGPRGHLGYSQIGKEDERTLWLNFRWCMPEIKDPRILRIFDNGNLVEDMLIQWTHDAGLRLETCDKSGKQFRFRRCGDHIAGSMDGAGYNFPEYPNEWFVWEAKSANDNRFKGLKKETEGSGRRMAWDDLQAVGLEAWSPEYWGQVQCYMGETALRRAVVIVYDKNTSHLHTEWVEFDDAAYQRLISKAERIVEATEPPPSLYRSPADWRSRLMMTDEESKIYWNQRLPPTANCRNCRFSRPDMVTEGAQWICGLHENFCGGIDRQLKGCDKHQFIPALMPASQMEPTDDQGVQYKTHDGLEFINGPRGYSSKELIELAKDEFAMLADPFFRQAKKELGATVVSQEDIWEKDIPF